MRCFFLVVRLYQYQSFFEPTKYWSLNHNCTLFQFHGTLIRGRGTVPPKIWRRRIETWVCFTQLAPNNYDTMPVRYEDAAHTDADSIPSRWAQPASSLRMSDLSSSRPLEEERASRRRRSPVSRRCGALARRRGSRRGRCNLWRRTTDATTRGCQKVSGKQKWSFRGRTRTHFWYQSHEKVTNWNGSLWKTVPSKYIFNFIRRVHRQHNISINKKQTNITLD